MKHLESTLQIVCVKWFKLQYPGIIIFAIPNGGARNAVTGAILKAEGVLAGIPDLFVARASHGAYGLFIEMKTTTGPVKPHQKELHKQLEYAGYQVVICRSFEDFKKNIELYLDNNQF